MRGIGTVLGCPAVSRLEHGVVIRLENTVLAPRGVEITRGPGLVPPADVLNAFGPVLILSRQARAIDRRVGAPADGAIFRLCQ